MAAFFDHLTPELIAFIGQQHMFFVATAPASGRISLSPKGLDTLRVVDETTVCYLDLTGSGNETSAHLLADGRMTLMFCSFGDKPLILRLYGRGMVIGPTDAGWPDALARFSPMPGIRQIVWMDVESVQTACGFAVPVFDFVSERPMLHQWAEKKGPEGLDAYRQDKNRTSIDGLPTHLGTRTP
jgi:hypothetical protein